MTPIDRTVRFESASRYYVVCCARDLFGGWLLSRYWGGLGTRRGGERHEPLGGPEAFEQAVARITRARLRHGYREIG